MLYKSILLAALVPLVAGNACVVSGETADVSTAQRCCNRLSAPDQWFSNSANQGICVFPEATQAAYEYCVAKWTAAVYDIVCIACDETTECGLTN